MSAPWIVVAASAQGTSHLQTQTPCQDAHAYRTFGENGLLIAVADGAGSAARAEHGARAAVDSALTALAHTLAERMPTDEAEWRAALQHAFADARAALEQLAESESMPLRAFATTLTCAVLCADWLAVGQIGDGALVARLPDGTLLTPIAPQRGEYANEAYFLTMPEFAPFVAYWVQPCAPIGAAVMSDGLLRLALQMPNYQPHPPFFAPLWQFAANAQDAARAHLELLAFLNSERVCARTDDDKTLVLAVRSEA